jgi:membrane protease YdiL (CAAX protease family)
LTLLIYAHWGFLLPESAFPEGISIFRWLLYNLIAIAGFEELFFRGYAQGRFESYANARMKNFIFGALVIGAVFIGCELAYLRGKKQA